MPLIMLAEEQDRARVIRGLDIGVHDFLIRPVDRNELLARIRTQVRRKRFTDGLRGSHASLPGNGGASTSSPGCTTAATWTPTSSRCSPTRCAPAARCRR